MVKWRFFAMSYWWEQQSFSSSVLLLWRYYMDKVVFIEIFISRRPELSILSVRSLKLCTAPFWSSVPACIHLIMFSSSAELFCYAALHCFLIHGFLQSTGMHVELVCNTNYFQRPTYQCANPYLYRTPSILIMCWSWRCELLTCKFFIDLELAATPDAGVFPMAQRLGKQI